MTIGNKRDRALTHSLTSFILFHYCFFSFSTSAVTDALVVAVTQSLQPPPPPSRDCSLYLLTLSNENRFYLMCSVCTRQYRHRLWSNDKVNDKTMTFVWHNPILGDFYLSLFLLPLTQSSMYMGVCDLAIYHNLS